MSRIIFVLFSVLLLNSPFASAELYDPDKAAGKPRISQLSLLDKNFQQSQRDIVDNLARINLGSQIRGNKYADISTLQRLLDERLVRADQKRELQAMGVILGDLLAKELGMNWIVYEDRLGRSRALRLFRDDQILFPVTMISRLAEVGVKVDVTKVYNNALEAMEKHKKRLPYS